MSADLSWITRRGSTRINLRDADDTDHHGINGTRIGADHSLVHETRIARIFELTGHGWTRISNGLTGR